MRGSCVLGKTIKSLWQHEPLYKQDAGLYKVVASLLKNI
jgi:hypothetical protein